MIGPLTFAWRAAAGFRTALAGIVVLGVMVALLESATLLALFGLISSLTSPRLGAPPESTPALVAVLTQFSVAAQVIIVTVTATLRYALALTIEWRMSRLWVGMRSAMQQKMLAVHLNAAYGYLLGRKAGDHMYQIMEGPSVAAVFYLHFARYLSTTILLAVLFLTLFAVSPALMLVAAAVAAVYGAIVRRVSVGISYASGQEQARAIRRQDQLVNEGLAGIRYLKALSAVPAWLSEFAQEAAAAELAMGRAGFWNTVPARTLEYLVLVVFLGVVLYALLTGGDLLAAVPTLAVYFLGIVRVLPTLAMLGTGRMQMMQALPNLQRYVELSEAIPREPERRGATDIPDLRRCPIVFEEVGFTYAEVPVLAGFSARIAPGGLTAIVAPSGQGKSTLLDLLLRLIEPGRGRIVVEGCDIREFDLTAWRARYAYLGQDPFLFHDTVLENIRLGRPGATDGEVEVAARMAGAEEFIAQLPQGARTVLADRGYSLSGGQRQRIALARALISQAEVLLLDEPTSALDADSADRVLEGMLVAAAGRTVVLVTHSERALQHADRILVLQGGRVLEAGRYEELCESGYHFRQMFRRLAPTG